MQRGAVCASQNIVAPLKNPVCLNQNLDYLSRMPSTSCERIVRELARLDAEIDRRDVAAVVTGLLRFIEGALHPASASVLLCDPESGACDAWRRAQDQSVVREPTAEWADIRTAAEHAIYCRSTTEACAAPDAVLRACAWPPDARSFVIVPLKTGRDVIGTFNLAAAAADGFSTDELALLDAAAPRAAAAVRVAQLLERGRMRLKACEWECPELQRRSERPGDGVETAGSGPAWGAVVGRSAGLRRVLDRVQRVAPTDAGVLILGESGTGKELVADEIHRRSLRAGRPLVKVNCASIPRELYESEFFGHVKGAFTGAISDRIGRFEAADGGTLFLDEVGEIPPGLQGKLLRVLQSGEFERVGEGRTRTVDVRIIAATNKRLPEEIAAGRFREDLYYRLDVFPIEVPALRDRPEDIPLLAAHAVSAAAARHNRACPRLTPEDERALQAHDWPGNVRELRNVIERAVILSGGGPLVFELPGHAPAAHALPAAEAGSRGAPVMTEAEVLELQRRNLTAALVRCNWRIYGPSGAAQLLGIKPTTLIERMRRMGIRRPG